MTITCLAFKREISLLFGTTDKIHKIIPIIWNQFIVWNNRQDTQNHTYHMKSVYCLEQQTRYTKSYLSYEISLLFGTTDKIHKIIPIIWNQFIVWNNRQDTQNHTYHMKSVYCLEQQTRYTKSYLSYEISLLFGTTDKIHKIIPIIWNQFIVWNNRQDTQNHTYYMKSVYCLEQQTRYTKSYLSYEISLLFGTTDKIHKIIPTIWMCTEARKEGMWGPTVVLLFLFCFLVVLLIVCKLVCTCKVAKTCCGVNFVVFAFNQISIKQTEMEAWHF